MCFPDYCGCRTRIQKSPVPDSLVFLMKRTMEANAMKRYGPLGMIGGSGLFIVLVYFLGFGDNHTLVPIEVNFGMQMDATAGPAMNVWARAPLPAFISMYMFNVSKKEPDGTISHDVDIFELFPTGDEVGYGSGFSKFSMKFISESEHPSLNMTMNMIPMVFKKDVEAGKTETFSMWVIAGMLSNWTLFSWMPIIMGVSLIGVGAGLLILSKKKELDNSVVTPILPDVN